MIQINPTNYYYEHNGKADYGEYITPPKKSLGHFNGKEIFEFDCTWLMCCLEDRKYWDKTYLSYE